MYTLLAAKVLPNTANAQWKAASLSNEIVSNTVFQNRKIFLQLQHSLSEDPIWVDFEQLKTEFATYANTFSVLLQTLGERTLIEASALPFKRYEYIRYSDARQSGYQIQLGVRGLTLPENYPRSEKKDLELTRPNTTTDLSQLHHRALISVNGFFHNTDTDGQRLWIADGGKTVQYGNMNHVGITSFMKVGQLKKLALADEQIQNRGGDQTLRDRVVLSFGEDLSSKSVFMILGGYLVWPQSDVFYQVSDSVFELNLQRLQYIERLLESRNYIDLSTLELTPAVENDAMINLEEAWSDEVIRRYLKLSQTFLVAVDADNLFYNRYDLRPMKVPGLFTTTEEPNYPLIVGKGHHTEYWKEKGDHRYAVTVMDKFYRNYIFERQQQSTLENVTDALDASRPFFHSQGFFFEIGTAKPE